MNKSFIIIAIALFSACFLQALKLEEVYPKMEKTYAKLNSWQATLNQTNYFSQTKTALKSQGNFYYTQGKAAIHYTKPAIQSLIINEGNLTVYDKASKTAIKSAFNSPLQSLNPVKIVRAYWIKSAQSIISSSKGKTQVLLKPKSDKQISEITFTLEDATGIITALSYKDVKGNTVSLNFSSVKVNQPIPTAIWQLKLPKDVKVINR